MYGLFLKTFDYHAWDDFIALATNPEILVYYHLRMDADYDLEYSEDVMKQMKKQEKGYYYIKPLPLFQHLKQVEKALHPEDKWEQIAKEEAAYNE